MSKHPENGGQPLGTASVTCAWVDDRLEAFLDGEIEAGSDAGCRIAHHLASCSRCQQARGRAEQILRGLRGLPVEACPPAVTERVMAAVADSAVTDSTVTESAVAEASPDGAAVVPLRRPTAPAHAKTRWWPLAAAALLVLALGLGYRGPSQPSGPAAAEVAQAETDVKLALAYLGQIGRQTGEVMGEEVLEQRLVQPMATSIRTLFAPNTEEGS